MSNAQQTVRYTGLNDKADQAGFVAVYPNGTGRWERMLTWNAGNCCGFGPAQSSRRTGLRAGIARPARRRNHRSTRGASLPPEYRTAPCSAIAWRLKCPTASPPSRRCRGQWEPKPASRGRPVSVIHFHGTADPFVPFDGGRGEKSLPTIRFFSVEHSIRQWVAADGCPAEPTVTHLPQKVDDGTSVIRKHYGPGRQGAEVVLIEIEGGGHTWPGRQLPIEFLGRSTKNISANDLMWDFFVRHPRE